MDLNYLGNVERYAFKTGFVVGDDDKTLNGTLNKTNVQLLIDTRNQWTYLFDYKCDTCVNNNQSRYVYNNNSHNSTISVRNVRFCLAQKFSFFR